MALQSCYTSRPTNVHTHIIHAHAVVTLCILEFSWHVHSPSMYLAPDVNQHVAPEYLTQLEQSVRDVNTQYKCECEFMEAHEIHICMQYQKHYIQTTQLLLIRGDFLLQRLKCALHQPSVRVDDAATVRATAWPCCRRSYRRSSREK
jgi:hypothetical protein